MTLDAYMNDRGLTDAAFAEMLGVAQTTISRARRHGQIPAKDLMAAIYRATEGVVTANDFYGLDVPERTEATGKAAA